MATKKKINGKNGKKQAANTEGRGQKPEVRVARAKWHSDLKPETKKSVFVVFLFLVTAFLVLSYIGQGGAAGSLFFRMFDFLLGKGYFFAPLIFALMGFSLLFSGPKQVLGVTLIGGMLLLVSCLTGFHVIFGSGTGGFLGLMLGALFLRLFDFWASVILVGGLLVISSLLIFDMPLLWKSGPDDEGEDGMPKEFDETPEEEAGGVKAMLNGIQEKLNAALEKKTGESAPQTQQQPIVPKQDEASISLRTFAKKFVYTKPPLELLQGDHGKPSSGDIRANANVIKRTLENFGIPVEMGEVSIGPTVTQYTLRPAEGVKLSRIIALHNDLSLALAAHPIRIEAPIPGKSLVGVEIPNRSIALVGIRALMETPAFQDAAQPLLLALGRDVTGAPVYGDLARMPHLLISGATGSGKSIAAHAIITSLLYRNPPEMLRFILVDPKRVELSVYGDIPHLLTPVITDAKTTVQALRWATKEMDRRYELLSMRHARDIVGYNAAVSKEPDGLPVGKAGEILPYIVLMIDELADLMALFPREIEHSVIRLAQMARAIGIHLIVATQRPSVEVITGLIKANITSRIAFQVASQVDSRTILDMAGAEKLLGNGDMLFLAGDTAKPRRLQGGFVAEQEVKAVVDFLREESEAPEFDEAILDTKLEEDNKKASGSPAGEFDDGDDVLYPEAKALVIDSGKASASYLQRRLRVGYARAARLLDLLEQEGVIGPGNGAKPREVLIKTADYIPNDDDDAFGHSEYSEESI